MKYNYNKNRDGSKETFKKVKFSVIIPTYNRVEKLEKCLLALSVQNFYKKEFEVIVVDDGSTDQTEEMIKRHQENKNLIIRYFVQKHQGAAAARNLGIKEAEGEIVLFIGDDIIPKREFLQEHMTFHRENPDVNVAVLGNTTVFPEIRTQFLVWFDQNYQFDYKSIKHGQTVSWRYFYTSNISLKKIFLIESGERFNPKFKGYGWEDTEFGYRLFKKGLIILYNQRAAAYHDHFFNLKEARKRLFRSGQSAWLFQQINPRAAELSDINYPSFFQKIYIEVEKIILWPARILYIKPFVWKYWARVFTQVFYQGFKSKDKKMKLVKVTIIIPNWNGRKFLEDCLKPLVTIDWLNYEIVIVDNGSTDDSIDFIEKNYPKIFLVKNKENLGFAAACNQGIKLALEHGADYVLLLNNDTVVAPDFLTKMIEAAEQDKKIGIIGAKIYYFDQPRKIWFAGGDFVWWRVSGKHRFWQKQEKQELTGVIPSDFVTGCAMLIKKQVFEDTGYFYEPFFLSVEDLDFCWRAKKNKWKIVVNLSACLWHKVSSSRDGEFSFSNGYYGTRNRLIFAFRRSKNYFGGFIFLFIIIPIRLFQWTISKKNQMVKGTILAVIDFLKGKSGAYVKSL